MRRSTKILAASAAALTISGFGASAALALDEDTACSDIANFQVCVLSETSTETVIAAAWNDDIAAVVAQYRYVGGEGTIAFAETDQAYALAGQQREANGTYTGGGAVVEDSDGDETWVEAVLFNDADDDSQDSLRVQVGQSDDQGNRATGLNTTNDDCGLVLANDGLADCPVQPHVPTALNVPFVNIP